jgi:catechol 2,3-dioxygenase-like lactoylglutathione lyase family enzyme
VYLSYVGIRVTNLEKSLKFYEELFGLEEVEHGDNSKFGMGVFVLLHDKRSGMKLELN